MKVPLLPQERWLRKERNPAVFVGGRRSGRVKKTLTPGERPQENNDEVYTADAHAYVQAKIVG